MLENGKLPVRCLEKSMALVKLISVILQILGYNWDYFCESDKMVSPSLCPGKCADHGQTE